MTGSVIALVLVLRQSFEEVSNVHVFVIATTLFYVNEGELRYVIQHRWEYVLRQLRRMHSVFMANYLFSVHFD